MTTKQDQSRAEFEAWAFPQFKAGFDEKGFYSDPFTWAAWCAWQAARRAPSVVPAEPAEPSVLTEEWLDLYCPDALRISPETASALRNLCRYAERDVRANLGAPSTPAIPEQGPIDMEGTELDAFFRDKIDVFAERHPALLVRQLAIRLREAWALLAAPSTPAVAVPHERLQNWIDVIHDNERSMGDRLQSLSSIFAGLLRGDAVDKYPLREIREQRNDIEYQREMHRHESEEAARLQTLLVERFNEYRQPYPESLMGWARAALDAQAGSAQAGKGGPIHPPCKGMNCGITQGFGHSLECQAEHAAAIAGGRFIKAAADDAGELPPLPEAMQTARNALMFLACNLVPHNPRAVAAGALEAVDAAIKRQCFSALIMPPLPNKTIIFTSGRSRVLAFTTDQMREYALAAIRASKEKP